MMKIAFNFMLKALLVLEIFKFLPCRVDKEAKVNFQTYDVTDWTANNQYTHTEQYRKNGRQSGNEIWSVDKI